jgi:3-oxoacyl-[acyl-carrier protein] reductase
MNIRLDGRTALVGGSSTGLGLAISEGLAEAGASLVMCARTQATLDEAAAGIREMGAEVLAIPTDLTQMAQIDRLATLALERFGTIDILVNNAGGPPSGTFDALPEEDWRHAVDLTLMSAVELTRRLLPGMRAQKWGRVINVTSTSVKQPVNGLMLSNSLRSAVIGWAKTLANEVGPDQILINNVCPGHTTTDRLEELAQAASKRQGLSVAEVYASWEQLSPLLRLGKPRELANLVVFLASDMASYINGTTIPVDGGRQQAMT